MNINNIYARFDYSGIRDLTFPLKAHSINRVGESKANMDFSDYSLHLQQDFHKGTLMTEAFSSLEKICKGQNLDINKASMQVQPEVKQLEEPWTLYFFDLMDQNYMNLDQNYKDLKSDYLVVAEMMLPGNSLKRRPPENFKKMRKPRHERDICSFAARSFWNGPEYQRFPYILVDFQYHLFNEEHIVSLFQQMCDNQRQFDHSAKASLKINVFQRLEGFTYLQAHYRSPYYYDSPYGAVTMKTKNS